MAKNGTIESEKSDKSDKSDKDSKKDKASFIQRLGAYIIDIVIVVFIASLIAVPFTDSDAVLKLTDGLYEVMEKYSTAEISQAAYMAESIPLTYQLARKNGVITLITLFLEVLYFIVFQYKNNGQTLGKKLLKIKVVSTNGEMTMNQMLIRALIINSILLDMIVFAFVIFASPNIYYYGSLVFEEIQNFVLCTSVVMIIFSKRGRGLHDLISRCEVIKEN